MFYEAFVFNSDLSKWNVAKVAYMDSSTCQFPLSSTPLSRAKTSFSFFFLFHLIYVFLCQTNLSFHHHRSLFAPFLLFILQCFNMLPSLIKLGATKCGRVHPSARAPSLAAAACPFAAFPVRSLTLRQRRRSPRTTIHFDATNALQVSSPPVPAPSQHVTRVNQASTRTRMESLNANDAGLVSGATR